MTWTRADNLAEHNNIIRWPKEDSDKAAAMWIEGVSAGVISKAFDGKYSRNAVISKMNRMGVQTPTKPQRAPTRPKPKRIPKPPKPTIEEKIAAANKRGWLSRDIARNHGVKAQVVKDVLSKLKLQPNTNESARVHPCWSWPEDERRQYFYERFMRGWKEVQERLRG